MTTASTTTPPAEAPKAPSPWLAHARVFVAHIEKICVADTGARAALRSGLGKRLDEVPRMHRIVAPLLPQAAQDEHTQRAFYTVAALIAAQKSEALRASRFASSTEAEAGREGDQAAVGISPYGVSLGSTFAAAVALGHGGLRESAAETRLNLLTRQSPAGLHRHLPSSVRQLCDKRTPPDWAQLLVHLRAWPTHRRSIGRRWLQDFYRARHKAVLDAALEADDATLPEDSQL
ncbi:type I-E CRISPR-associated protein Cse2/CasB [Streptomyces sp. NPDC058045]|uniref:type I-E CRISPR-associated protein Cse2/CasB n=1 Tax=Streptomyces sp. NPDC058045 TaxID=3346311 RepID=UPI0036EFCAF8